MNAQIKTLRRNQSKSIATTQTCNHKLGLVWCVCSISEQKDLDAILAFEVHLGHLLVSAIEPDDPRAHEILRGETRSHVPDSLMALPYLLQQVLSTPVWLVSGIRRTSTNCGELIR